MVREMSAGRVRLQTDAVGWVEIHEIMLKGESDLVS